MTDARNMDQETVDQEEQQGSKEQLKKELKSIKIQRRDMFAMGVDTADLSAIFLNFLFEVGREFIEHIGRFFMFPLAMFAAWVRLVFAWQHMQVEKYQKGTLLKFVVEAVSTVLVSVAVLGGLIATAVASAAFNFAAPIIFTIVMAGKALFSLGSAFYYWTEKKAEEDWLKGRKALWKDGEEKDREEYIEVSACVGEREKWVEAKKAELAELSNRLKSLEELQEEGEEDPNVLFEVVKAWELEAQEEGLKVQDEEDAIEVVKETIKKTKSEIEECVKDMKNVEDAYEKIKECEGKVKNNLIGFVATTLAAVAIGGVMLAKIIVVAVLGVVSGVIGTVLAAVNYKKFGARKAEILQEQPELESELALEEAQSPGFGMACLWKALGCTSVAPAPDHESEPLVVPMQRLPQEIDGCLLTSSAKLQRVNDENDNDSDNESADDFGAVLPSPSPSCRGSIAGDI